MPLSNQLSEPVLARRHAAAVEIASLPFTGPSGGSAPASASGGVGGGPSSSALQPPPPQSLALLLLDRGLDLAAPALHADHPWDVLAAAVAARQAATAVAEAAAGAAASGTGRQHHQPGHAGGPHRPRDATVLWRCVVRMPARLWQLVPALLCVG